MSDMIDFAVAMLSAISDFLSAEPMIYVFSFILLAFIFKIFAGFLSLPRK